MGSIHRRLFLAASLVLAGFLGVTGLTLETAFRTSSESALKEKLQSYVFGLLAAAEVDEKGRMALPEHLPEPRLSQPDSGFYALVMSSGNKLFWRSASLLGNEMPAVTLLPAGERRFGRLDHWFVFSHGVEWEDDLGQSWPFTLVIAEEAHPFEQTVGEFRRTLWSWLAGLALGLLLVQGAILRWGLSPLRRIEREVRAIQAGDRDDLSGDYPTELQGLAENLNALMAHSRSVQTRYRNRLDDLAHSLKTPLAYLQSVSDDEGLDCQRLRAITTEQLGRMNSIVQHQLQRAAASGRITLMTPVEIAPLVERLLATLEKIYGDKRIEVQCSLAKEARFRGDQADMMELLGALLENAFKYGKGQVRVSLTAEQRLRVEIEDDGPGIPAHLQQEMLRRGTRMDENAPGQGIGLSVANEIVQLYRGELLLEESDLGGARVVVLLPAAS